MKRLVYVSALFGIVALMVLLVVGSAGAESLGVQGVPGGGEPEPGGLPGGEELVPEGDGPSLRVDEDDEEEPLGTAVRINFEVSGHKAARGLYIIQEPGGDVVASWYALDGWTSSEWFDEIDIARETIHVQVLYYPGPNTSPTVMRILNHAPGSSYGWMSRDVAHAIEVSWPDRPIASPEGGGPVGAGASPEEDEGD